MKLAFVSGPYRAKTEFGIKCNIEKAEKTALELWKKGYAVICPHKNTAFFGGAFGLDDSVWLKGGIEMLSKCDILVMSPGWKFSNGSIDEYNHAVKNKIPIYDNVEDVPKLI